MKRTIFILTLLLVGVFASGAQASTSCKSVRDVVPTGVDDIPATKIRATGVTCKFARSLPRKTVYNVRYGHMNPDVWGAEALGLANWHCRLPAANGYLSVCWTGTDEATAPKQVSWIMGKSNGTGRGPDYSLTRSTEPPMS